MIIWSGLGILIPLVAIAGVILGSILSGALGQPGLSLGLGFGLAALGNWGLWKLIYPKQPRVLVDPATGQQVLLNPKHGLFFIPAKAWTWVLAILAVPMMLLGVAGERENAKEAAKPGFKEYTTANDLIDSKRQGLHHGNTDAAKQAAAGFASGMKTMTEILFEGGSKKNLMTGGDFLTYCHDGPETIVVLCHVPSLRSYKSEETKKSLADIAWGNARRAVTALDPDHKKTLLVGLRGITSYGSIQKGKADSEAASTSLDTSDKSVFFPAFIPAAPTPQP
jgi:hypothetical protein